MLSSSIAFQSGCEPDWTSPPAAIDAAANADVNGIRTENDFAIVIDDSSRWHSCSEITPARAHRHGARRHAHQQGVHLAIEHGRCEAESVLMMQFVGNPREGRGEIVRGGQ